MPPEDTYYKNICFTAPAEHKLITNSNKLINKEAPIYT